MTRQKVNERLFTHETGLRLLFGTIQPKDAVLANSLQAMEALVNRLSYLAPYLVLDLGAGLTPMVQKLLPACALVVVIAEPVANSAAHSRALIADLVEMGVKKTSIKMVMVTRLRSDTNLNIAQMEELTGQPPVVNITAMPELIYVAARTKTTVVGSRPDSLTTQQMAKLAASVLDFEKQKK
jgi:MinD-like ATPase involved in chromosome partitioning or flagellar assembly